MQEDSIGRKDIIQDAVGVVVVCPCPGIRPDYDNKMQLAPLRRPTFLLSLHLLSPTFLPNWISPVIIVLDRRTSFFAIAGLH